MITLFTDSHNTLNQKSYITLIDKTDIHSLTCPSCHQAGHVVKHAYYYRPLKTPVDGDVSLCILRVKCQFCGKTHAVVPSTIVPYSQVSLDDHLDVISCVDHDDKTCSISVNNDKLKHFLSSGYFHLSIITIRNILNRFIHYWWSRLVSALIPLSCDQIVQGCFKHYSRQFMQCSSCIQNILYVPST